MKILITRHKALKEFLRVRGFEFAQVLEQATAEDVKDADVYGVLPLHLASLAKSITTVDLDLPFEKRGKELTVEEIELYFTGMSTYEVRFMYGVSL